MPRRVKTKKAATTKRRKRHQQQPQQQQGHPKLPTPFTPNLRKNIKTLLRSRFIAMTQSAALN